MLSCTRKTTREVIGLPPVALETPTLPATNPSQPEFNDAQPSEPRFDGGRPETVAIPANNKPSRSRFVDVYSELSGQEAVSCEETKP